MPFFNRKSSHNKHNNNHKPDPKTGIYPPILAMKDWGIFQLSQHRNEFIDKVCEEAEKHIIEIIATKKTTLKSVIESTFYAERFRIKEKKWAVDPPNEMLFWETIYNDFLKDNIKKDTIQPGEGVTELKKIIRNYAEEIAGNFSPKWYNFATKWVTRGMLGLLNIFNIRDVFKTFVVFNPPLGKSLKTFDHKKVAEIRELATKSTLLIVPTHFSNLDSLLIGLMSYMYGLPALMYGAGLNLFNDPLFAKFMNNLGAYKIDRRKKSMLYIETLKVYSRMSLQANVHSLFFPGGARSRIGQIEENLKLGLLSSAIETQRLNLISPPFLPLNASQPTHRKIVIVPMVINYHFVLEASSLIEEFLKTKDKVRYLDEDPPAGVRKTIKFFKNFMKSNSEIMLSLGNPIDVFGNKVEIRDNEVVSVSTTNSVIDISQYFKDFNGNITNDPQRESQYTEMLGDKIVESFYKANVVLDSHLVAFVAYQMIKNKHAKLDVFSLRILPASNFRIAYSLFVKAVENVRKGIEMKGINTNFKPTDPTEMVIAKGLRNLGMYHTKLPLEQMQKVGANEINTSELISNNISLLYYYHNRLKGRAYELEKFIFEAD